ncbi:MAG: hypothetical protein AAB456_04070 [Patescibacteria group bacterium]
MEEKRWFASTTIQGNIVAAVGLLVQLFKLPVLGDEVSQVVSAVFVLIGVGVSVYGRVKTKGEKLK